jgi:hypothetical protein
MSLESEIPNIVIQSIVTVVSILFIGWKIKDALCNQISQIEIRLGTHLGISEPQTKELYGRIDAVDSRLDKLIVSNHLKV